MARGYSKGSFLSKWKKKSKAQGKNLISFSGGTYKVKGSSEKFATFHRAKKAANALAYRK